MSTTTMTTTTTTSDRRDRYGPMEWAQQAVSPGRGRFAAVAGLVRAAHLVHPRAAVVSVAAVHEARLPVHADVIVET